MSSFIIGILVGFVAGAVTTICFALCAAAGKEDDFKRGGEM